MSDTQIDHLKTHIDSGANETKSYLDQLKKKVDDYDRQYKLSETASSYLQSGMDTANESVEELNRIGNEFQAKSKTASDQTMQSADSALRRVRHSLDDLQTKAREYDRKFASSRGAKMSDTIENVVNSARQRTTDAIEMASEQLTRMKGNVKHGAQVVGGETAKAAEVVDEKLGVTPLVNRAADTVAETVKSIDQRLHVSETAAKIDEKVTGGLGAKVVHKGTEMVHESIAYVSETIQQAKITAGQSPQGQRVEAMGQQAVEQATSVKESAESSLASAKSSVQQTAETAKEKVMSATGMNENRPVTEQAKDKAGQVKESVKDTACSAKDKADQATEGAKQKGWETKEAAKQKGTELKEGAKEKGGELQEGAENLKEGVKQKGAEVKESAKEKGAEAQEGAKELKEGAKQKGTEAKQGAKESMPSSSSTGSSSSSGGGLIENIKERAKELGSSAKEAAMGMSSGESATDVQHKQQQEQQQHPKLQRREPGTVEQTKDTMADTMSSQKGVMKDATKM